MISVRKIENRGNGLGPILESGTTTRFIARYAIIP
jgi:hypothetical protein